MDADASLPEEMIIQIVMRLPVKSVGRCRCVSTRWRSLFSDPQFAKSHFQVSPKHQSLIFILDGKLKTLDFDLSNTASFKKESLILRDLKAPLDHTWLGFLGSCNGLVALGDFGPISTREERLFIWNPSTGFVKKLPSRRLLCTRFIFGFGCVSDEYKLVMGCEIYSSKTNSWELIRSPNCVLKQRGGVLCRDALHWRPAENGDDVYAFDMGKEEFSVVKMLEGVEIDVCDFGVTCEGWLFVMGCCDHVVEFWVMREYGNSDSWTRSLSVKIPGQTQSVQRRLFFGAISVMETRAFVRNLIRVKEEEEEEEKFMSTTYLCNDEENTGIYIIESGRSEKVVYEESLCCLA